MHCILSQSGQEITTTLVLFFLPHMKSYFIKIKQLLREQIANIEIVVKRSHHLVVAESHMDFTVGHIDDSLLAIDHTDHVDVGHDDF